MHPVYLTFISHPFALSPQASGVIRELSILGPQPSTLHPQPSPHPSSLRFQLSGSCLRPQASDLMIMIMIMTMAPTPHFSLLTSHPSPLTPHPSPLTLHPSTLGPQLSALTPHPSPAVATAAPHQIRHLSSGFMSQDYDYDYDYDDGPQSSALSPHPSPFTPHLSPLTPHPSPL